MATFFNEKLLEELSCNDPFKYLALLDYHCTGNIAKSRHSKYKPASKSLTGKSFLLNPRDIIHDKSNDVYHKVQYIKLAARRDYTLWKLYKYSGIQRSYYPDLNIEAAKHNPLLIVTPTEINFKYER